MIKLKTTEEIEKMRQGGHILAWVLDEVIKIIKPGVGTEELTDLAEKLIIEQGGRPSFKNYRAAWAEHVYPSALCVSINDEVVHGLPTPNRILQEGDIVGLDCGMEYQKMYTDMAKTVGVGKISAQADKLLKVTEQALFQGIDQIKPGNSLHDLASAIEKYTKQYGFSIVKDLVGHGVGYEAHEEPQIPNFLDYSIPNFIFKPGMTLAIEPMVNVGTHDVETLDDGWTIVTSDGSLSAHFEHTVVVTENGFEILTLL